MSTPTETAPAPPARMASIDAYRGLVMVLMIGEALHFRRVADALPDVPLWDFLAYHQEHVEWIGCSLHDLIQPGFSFLVGVALPFSLASRAARGLSTPAMILRACWRAVILVFLGIFLRSMRSTQTNFTFEDTLTQIGLGYPFLFLLGLRPRRDQWIALGVILVGVFAAFALYPTPGTDFDHAAVGVKESWLKEYGLSGFQAHWNKNSNLAWAFDTWFLNLFPRPKPFEFNGGGYATLSFIPTLGTMILGLLAGGVLRDDRSPARKLAWLATAGLISLGAGYALGWMGICPVVKRIWTPSWVLFSGGWCFLFLAFFYATTDALGWKGWAFPLIVVGANSIAAYVMSWTMKGWISQNLKIHLGETSFDILGTAYAPMLEGAAVLLVIWLILFWMYRRPLFLRI
jgi:predicted acyltransferase